MKKIFYILTLCICPLFITSSHAQNSAAYSEPLFFEALHDIPLMHGLTEIQNDTTSYDKPNGRIIDAFATINGVSKRNILAYYRATLPQFGWGIMEDGKFYRENEILELTFEKSENSDILKISIRPSL